MTNDDLAVTHGIHRGIAGGFNAADKTKLFFYSNRSLVYGSSAFSHGDSPHAKL